MVETFLSGVIAPGFFQSGQVQNALLLGGIVAIVCGIFGVFVIIRGQAFVGHALSDFGGAGAALAFLTGVNTLWGFLVFGLLSAAGAELLGKRAKEHDISTGVVLSTALGLEALFLFLDTHLTGSASAPMLILFGSVFMVRSVTVVIVACMAAGALLILCAIYRPLLFCSLDAELARTRGIPVRFVGLIFIFALAIIVEEASLAAGALLGTALLIGPASAAVRITHKMRASILLSAGIGLLSMWLGILLAYDSYYWPPVHRGWPVSFFVCLLLLLFYFLSGLKIFSREARLEVRVRA